MSTQHTPTPWHLLSGKLRPQYLTKIIEILGKGKTPIVSWAGFDDSARSFRERRANAAFIVLACNNHAALLEAAKEGAAGLREVIAYLRRDGGFTGLAEDRLKVLDAAIAAVEERTE